MVYFFPLFSTSLTPLGRLLRDPILAEAGAVEPTRGFFVPRTRPHRRRRGPAPAPTPGAAAASPRAPRALPPRPGRPGAHSFGSAFLRPCLLPLASPRVCSPSPPVLSPASARDLWLPGASPSHVDGRPPARSSHLPFLPAAAFPPSLSPGAGPRIHTPFSLGLRHASPGHAALLVTCLEVGAPTPSTCATRPSDSGAAWTSDP